MMLAVGLGSFLIGLVVGFYLTGQIVGHALATRLPRPLAEQAIFYLEKRRVI